MGNSLAEKVSERISEDIRSGRYRPGEKIPSEPVLADEAGVGRSTVREAVKELVTAGVLEIRRGEGTYVCAVPGIGRDPLGLNFISDRRKAALDLSEIRLLIEPWAASAAAARAGDEEIARLDALRIETEKKIAEGVNHSREDIAFHSFLAECTGNSVMPNLIPILMRAIPLFIEVTESSLAGETVRTHREICAAVRHHDPESAEKAMREHILLNRTMILSLDE